MSQNIEMMIQYADALRFNMTKLKADMNECQYVNLFWKKQEMNWMSSPYKEFLCKVEKKVCEKVSNLGSRSFKNFTLNIKT